MYVCHYYNLEVTKTTIVRFSARPVEYPIGRLVAFKRGRFYLCDRFTKWLLKKRPFYLCNRFTITYKSL